MNRLSRNFYREEFQCRCGCGFDTLDIELLEVLERLREFFNESPVTITSGCRCEKYNKRIGGSKDSLHLIAQGSDIQVRGYTPKLVADYLEDTYPDKYGIGRYPTHTHIDIRRGKARWTSI